MPVGKGMRCVNFGVLLVYVLLLAIGISCLVQSWDFWAKSLRAEPVGPWAFPFVFSILWVVGIAIIIVFEIIKRKSVTDLKHKTDIHDVRIARGLLLLFLALSYTFIVEKTGFFIICSMIYIVAMMLSLGAVKKKALLGGITVSVILVLILYFSYTMVFHVPLPGGF